MSAKNTFAKLVARAVKIVQRLIKPFARFVTTRSSQRKQDREGATPSSERSRPVNSEPFDVNAPEIRALDQTRSIPMNRKERRARAKAAGVRFNVVNEGMIKRPPVYLGIKQFKKAAHDPKLAAEYKENAHLSLRELSERRQREAAEIREAKELSDKDMKKVKNARRTRTKR